MTLSYRKGNAFGGRGNAVVVTVNCVGAMGAGIALECKQKMPWLYSTYRRYCFRGAYAPGRINTDLGVFTNCVEKSKGACRHMEVILLPTKLNWKNASKIEWIESGIEDLAALASLKQYDEIDMTLPGCANGWIKDHHLVKSILADHLEDHPCRFVVWEL